MLSVTLTNFDILCCILISLPIISYLYLSWNHNIFKKRGIPYVKPNIFFGNFKEAVFGENHTGLIVREIYRKFPNAAYVGSFKARNPGIIVRDPELIRRVMIKEFNNFSQSDVLSDPEQDPLFAYNPFSLVGEHWKKTRLNWGAMVTPNKLKQVHENNINQCVAMNAYIKKHLNEKLNAKQLSLKFLTNIIVSSVFGLDAKCFENDNDPFEYIASNLFCSSTRNRIIFLIASFAPNLLFGKKAQILDRNIQDKIFDLAEKMLENLKDTNNQFIKNEEFEAYATKEQRSESIKQLAIKLFGFILDGTETTSGPLSMCLYMIAAHPHVQKKLREEVDEAYGKNGSLSYEKIVELPYIHQIICETLRMYPVMAIHSKICSKRTEFPPAVPGGKPFFVEKGMTVDIPVYAVHTDPQYYTEPDVFNPERFDEGEKKERANCTFFPFGEGSRLCLGYKLGLLNVKLGIVELVRNFEIELCPDNKNVPLTVDPNSFVIRPTETLYIMFKERKSEKLKM